MSSRSLAGPPTSASKSVGARRPSPLLAAAVESAVSRLRALIEGAIEVVPSSPGELLRLEQRLHQDVARECLDRIVGAVIQEAHSAPVIVDAANEIIFNKDHLRLQDARETVQVNLLGGSTVRITTPYYLRRPPRGPGRPRGRGRRGKAGNGLYPVLAVMGIHYRASPALASEVARLMAMGTEEATRQTLKLRGISMNHKVIRRLAKRLAGRGLEHRQHTQSATQHGYKGTEARGKRLFIGVDGGRLRTRVDKKKGRKRSSGRRGFDAPWREPKVITIYEVDAEGRKVRGGLLRYDATMQDANGTFAILASYLLAIGAHLAAQWVIGGDGADWIWDRVDPLIAAVGYDKRKVTQVVDYYHASQRIYEIAELVKGWRDRDRMRWISRAKRLLSGGRIDDLVDEITQFCQGRNSKKIRRLMPYFSTHRERMAYAKFRRLRVPLGSGAVESCVRRVVNLRTKGNGIFWEEENAEDVLHLRAQLLSGQWEKFVDEVLRPREHWLSCRATATRAEVTA